MAPQRQVAGCNCNAILLPDPQRSPQRSAAGAGVNMKDGSGTIPDATTTILTLPCLLAVTNTTTQLSWDVRTRDTRRHHVHLLLGSASVLLHWTTHASSPTAPSSIVHPRTIYTHAREGDVPEPDNTQTQKPRDDQVIILFRKWNLSLMCHMVNCPSQTPSSSPTRAGFT